MNNSMNNINDFESNKNFFFVKNIVKDSKFYYKHSLSYDQHEVKKFYSAEKMPELLNDLEEFFQYFFSRGGHIDIELEEINYGYYGNTLFTPDRIKTFYDSLKGNSIERVLQFFSLMGSYDRKNVHRKVKEHLKNFEDKDLSGGEFDYANSILFLHPYVAEFGYRGLKTFRLLNTKRDKKLFLEDEDYRNFMINIDRMYEDEKLFNYGDFTLKEIFEKTKDLKIDKNFAHISYDNTIFYKDIELYNAFPKKGYYYVGSDKFWDRSNLPFHYPSLRSYLLDKTLDGFLSLHGKVKNKIPESEIISFCDSFIDYEDSADYNNFYESNKLLIKLFESNELKGNKKINDIDFWRKVQNLFVNTKGKIYSKEILVEYFKNIDMNSFSRKRFFDTLKIFLDRTLVSTWCVGGSNSDYVVHMLSDKLSAKEIVDVVQSVSIINKPIPLEKWSSFKENYEDFKDAPASWWISLI